MTNNKLIFVEHEQYPELHKDEFYIVTQPQDPEQFIQNLANVLNANFLPQKGLKGILSQDADTLEEVMDSWQQTLEPEYVSMEYLGRDPWGSNEADIHVLVIRQLDRTPQSFPSAVRDYMKRLQY